MLKKLVWLWRLTELHARTARALSCSVSHAERYLKELISTITMDVQCCVWGLLSSTQSPEYSKRAWSFCGRTTGSKSKTSCLSMPCDTPLNVWDESCEGRTTTVLWFFWDESCEGRTTTVLWF